MRTLLLVLLLGGSPSGTDPGTVTTPIGVFVVPDGCRSGRIDYGIDPFMGSIECPKHRLSITVFGYAGGIVDPCDPSKPRATGATDGLLQDPFRMTLETGVPVSACRKKRKGTRGEVIQELVLLELELKGKVDTEVDQQLQRRAWNVFD